MTNIPPEKPKVVTIFGTRPEAIKLFPVVRALATRGGLHSLSCVTAQHREMLDQVLEIADHDMFKSIPLDERAEKVVYDTRGIWPDQPDNLHALSGLRLAS